MTGPDQKPSTEERRAALPGLQHLSAAAAAEKFGVHERTIHRDRRILGLATYERPEPLTPGQVRRMENLIVDGCPLAEIARTVGRSPKTIAKLYPPARRAQIRAAGPQPLIDDRPRETVYIAGPMSGKKDYNYPAFEAAAAEIRAAGYNVISPHELHNGNTSKPYAAYMRAGILAMLECDRVALLPGWQDSKGASCEAEVARLCGLTVSALSTMRAWGELDATK